MIFEKLTENLSPEQMTIFNHVMKSSFYYPIAASRSEPKTNYPTDVIEPAAVTSFYTEYFADFAALHDRDDDDIFEYIRARSLCEFINEVSSIISQLSSEDELYLLEDAKAQEVEDKAYFEETGVTLEEHHSLFHTTKMVSQLKRYLEAYGSMLDFQYEYEA